MAIFKATPPAVAGVNDAQPRAAVASSKTAPDAADDSAKQTVATQPLVRYMIFGIGCLAGGLVGGILLQRDFHPDLTKLPVLPASVGAFALLYVMAQAIERVLVPVSWFGGGFLGGLGPKGIKSNSKSSLAKQHQAAAIQALKEPASQEKAQGAANAQHALDQYKANLTAATFGLAALLAMLVSGYAGVFMLHIIGLHTAGWLDVLVTGLAIAGGTKPLHDLISNVSSAKKPAASA